jgi:hypothetical protein
MTNLLEKALITGFGLFVLIIFLSIIAPFLGEISNYFSNIDNDLEDCSIFFDEIDNAITFIIEKPESVYLKEIGYPKNLNVSFYGNQVRYEYLIDNKLHILEKSYNESFVQSNYRDVIPKNYLLKVSYILNSINVSID